MRTTVDLPPAVHRRAKELAHRTGRSLSHTIADLTARALDQLDDDVPLDRDPRTGAPVVHLGRVTTAEDVERLWDDG